MRKYYIHILLIILGTILYFGANFERVAIPGAIFDTLQTDFSLTAPQVTAFGAIFMYAYAFTLFFSGLLVDKFTGIKVLLAGSTIFSLGAFLFTNSSNLWVLYTARALLGCGAATFYISLIEEAKKCFPDKYFGVAISVILFLGFLGGVCANAPFIALCEAFGWKNILNIIGIIFMIVTVSYGFFHLPLKTLHENKKVKFCPKPFLEVLKNKNNLYLYAFVALNGGLYYSLQTIIGVKFLKDFLHYSTHLAAIFLSVMIVCAAFSAIILASLSKMFNNRKVIFLKITGIMSIIIFGIISLCIYTGYRTPLVAVLLVVLAVCGGLSPLTVSIVHATNKYEIRGTAVSLMNSIFFLVVGILGTMLGYMLDLFKPVSSVNGYVVYGSNSYLTIFLLFLLISITEVFVVFRVKDSLEVKE